MARSFAVSWDYRCPFARNAHEHLVAGLQAGADWDVTFLPFSLGQVHVKEGELDVWDDETKLPGLVALAAGVAVRDDQPDRFLDAHLGLFRARHVDGRDIREWDVLADVLAKAGADVEAVKERLDDGSAVHQLRKEHEAAVADVRMWGVPTFVAGGRGVFVRFMHRPEGDTKVAIDTIERTVDLVAGWLDLNEFKQTFVPR